MNSPQPAPNPYYPDLLQRAEDELVSIRRRAAQVDPNTPRPEPHAPRLGLALSGGGIRSATFNLGILQALARARLLRRVDFLSTVSGGGYIGGFVGAWMARAGRNVGAVEDELRSPTSSKPVWFLRENGRYLAPNGAGDLWAAGSAVLRSWVAVLGLLGLFSFAFFLLAVFAREAVWPMFASTKIVVRGYDLWLSPSLTLALGVTAVAVVPLIVAFWSLGARPWRVSWFFAALAVLGAGAAAWEKFCPLCEPAKTPDATGLILGAAAAVVAVFSWIAANALSQATPIDLAASPTPSQAHGDIDAGRRLLTDWLAGALVVTSVLLIVGLADTFAESWLLQASAKRVAALHVAVAAVIAVGKLLWSGVSKSLEGKTHAPVSLTVVAGIAAFLIALALYTLLDLWALRIALALDARIFIGNDGTTFALGCLAWLSAGVWLVCLIAGRAMTFLNLSSHQQLYAARITRAYLGATNPVRQDSPDQDITSPMPGDQISWRDYRPHAHGGPLHLVNVTVNETVSAKSHIEQSDRKGFGLTIGPAALSAGRVHHALLFTPLVEAAAVRLATSAPRAEDTTRWNHWGDEHVRVFPLPTAAGGFPLFGAGGGELKPAGVLGRVEARVKRSLHAVLGGTRPAAVAPDRVALASRDMQMLPLGGWVGVSGAAFSTGLGARTSRGLSFLAGLFNVRLGYWWDSGVNPGERAGVRTPPGFGGELGARLAQFFPAQMHLADEWLARFHGPARRRWYLTDGGHFENTAAYELIRRRVPLIVVCDCGEDAGYAFDDVGNLVRLARTDFDAEIRFLGAERLNTLLAPPARKLIGSLNELGLGGAAASGAARFNARHAALAEVYYPGDTKPGSVLLLVKPSVTGDEPADVLNYHTSNPAFPQQSTADQFFDEAQWESYRKLGQVIGDGLFGCDAAELDLAALLHRLRAESSAPFVRS